MTSSSFKSFHTAVAVGADSLPRARQSSEYGSEGLGRARSGRGSDGGSDLKSDHLVNIRLLAARRANPLGFYSQFPDRWRKLLHGEFLDAAEVAGFFKVSQKAAEKWWQGLGGPHGDKLDYALRELPRAYAVLYGRG